MSGTQLNFSYIYTPVKLFDLTILFWYFNVKYVIINPMKESRLTKKINEKALNILEFNKVISHLTDYADSDPAKNICGRIKPFTDKEKVNESLDQTNDALRRIYAKGKVSFRGIVSVREMIKRLNAGATLNTIELLRLGDLLECASHVMNYYEPSQDSLSPFFDALVNIPELESEIRRCIISEEEINEGLISKNLLNTQFIEKIEKTLHKYEKETTDVIARIVGKHCKSASLDNISKRRLEQREIILESLNTDQIKEINNNEERICLVLDNYSTHKSKFIKKFNSLF